MGKRKYQAANETREKILNSSARLFYKNGFEPTLYDHICKEAGVNRALIPYHFKNKSDLALAVYDRFIEDYVITRNMISEGYSNDEKLIIGILYYYKLIEDNNAARFIEFVISENSYRERLLLGESIMYKQTLVESRNISDARWNMMIHLIWGMEVEVTKMIADNSCTNQRQLEKMFIHMVYQYFGYSKENIDKTIAKVYRILNKYSYEITDRFQINVYYKNGKKIL